MLYDFFIGSTDWYDAHSSTQHADAFPSLEWWRNNAVCQNVYGVWEGETENVLQVTVPLKDDAAAHMIAYAIARRTGNDAVLVSRLAIKGEESLVFGSTRRYLVSTETRFSGNRTIVGNPHNDGESFTQAVGYAYVRDSRGSHVAYLVWSDARVTAVD